LIRRIQESPPSNDLKQINRHPGFFSSPNFFGSLKGIVFCATFPDGMRYKKRFVRATPVDSRNNRKTIVEGAQSPPRVRSIQGGQVLVITGCHETTPGGVFLAEKAHADESRAGSKTKKDPDPEDLKL
jgi:hypothetical protein